MKFKLLEGQHVQGGYWTPDGKRVRGKTYVRGDVFESKTDLTALNPVGGRRPKFERLPDDAPVQKAPQQPAAQQAAQQASRNKPNFSALEAMSLKQLQDWAAGEEVEVGNAKTKEEVLKAVKAHYGA